MRLRGAWTAPVVRWQSSRLIRTRPARLRAPARGLRRSGTARVRRIRRRTRGPCRRSGHRLDRHRRQRCRRGLRLLRPGTLSRVRLSLPWRLTPAGVQVVWRTAVTHEVGWSSIDWNYNRVSASVGRLRAVRPSRQGWRVARWKVATNGDMILAPILVRLGAIFSRNTLRQRPRDLPVIIARIAEVLVTQTAVNGNDHEVPVVRFILNSSTSDLSGVSHRCKQCQRHPCFDGLHVVEAGRSEACSRLLVLLVLPTCRTCWTCKMSDNDNRCRVVRTQAEVRKERQTKDCLDQDNARTKRSCASLSLL